MRSVDVIVSLSEAASRRKHMTRKCLYSLRTAIILTVLAICAHAQDVGSIVGTVTDPKGAVVDTCQVTVVEVSTGLSRMASCGPNGYYVVPSLRPANYRLTVTAPGFSTLARESITLQANQVLTVDLQLRLGVATQTVMVQGAAAQVNTTTATLSQVIDSSRIVDLPLDGRNAATLTTLVAGAVNAPDARATQGLTIPQDVTISVNGSRGNQTSYNLDGASNTDQLTDINAPFPFPDALQEFSVQTGNYSAQYGQSSGAVVNIVSKSGTNNLHGDAFEFVRNAVFNARNYFEANRDQLKRNQFGFTFGGPIVHDRTFFFVGFQKTILRDTLGAQYAYVPTLANVGGDFSALLSATNPDNPVGQAIQLTNPQTGLPYPGDIIPQGQLDPVFLNFEKDMPQNNANGLVSFPSPVATSYTEAIGRVDQKLSSKDELTGRYYYDKYNNVSPYVPGDFLTEQPGTSIPDHNFMVKEVHIFRPNLLNDFHFSLLSINAFNTVPSGMPTMSSLGVKVNQDFVSSGNMGMSVYGFFYANGAWPTNWDRKSYQYGDDLHWVHGKHNLGFGALVMRSSYNNVNGYNVGPQFTFSGDATGYALADLAIGAERVFLQSSGQRLNVAATQLGFYAQDDFHATSRLTLNAGLRYEPFLPWHETQRRELFFSPSAYAAGVTSTQFPNAPPGLLFPGDNGFPGNGVKPNYKGWAPRMGFAYDVFGNGNTSIRGGFGMFYDTSQVMVADIPFSTNPFAYNVNMVSPAGPWSNPYLGTTDPFPAPPPGPSATFPANPVEMTYDPFHTTYQTPVSYAWNLTTERQLTQSWLARLGYVGSHGSHGLEMWELNPAIYIPGSTLPTNSRRLYPGYGNISSLTHDVNSSYNALQATLQKKFSHGFTVMANYTYSKSLDDLPESAAVNSGLVPAAIPWYMPNFHRLDYGPSDWDRTHAVVVSYLWQIPTVDSSNGFARKVLGNWETSGIVSKQTGPPFTVFAGQDISKTNLGKDRAVVSGDPYGGDACAGISSSCKSWLNPAAFSLPAPGTFGDATKGEFRGPGYFDTDLSIFKNIPIREQVRMQFRCEFFNAFNNVNFTHVNDNVSGGGLGAVQQAANFPAPGGPRTIQFALKFIF
jgi:outer membrane receptor protein involved in Fe transport